MSGCVFEGSISTPRYNAGNSIGLCELQVKIQALAHRKVFFIQTRSCIIRALTSAKTNDLRERWSADIYQQIALTSRLNYRALWNFGWRPRAGHFFQPSPEGRSSSFFSQARPKSGTDARGLPPSAAPAALITN
jgi:hypothetical protein